MFYEHRRVGWMTWAGFKTSVSAVEVSGDDTPTLQRAIFGRFMLPDRSEHSCTAAHVSPDGAELRGSAPAPSGARLIVYLERLGRIEACAGEETEDGFAVHWILNDLQRSKLHQKIRWLADHDSGHASEDRQYYRRLLQDACSVITLMDGRQVPCEVTDISVTGAGVAMQMTADIGERVYLGTLLCEVMRVTDTGYGLKFLTGHGSDLMNQLVSKVDRTGIAGGSIS